MQLRTRKRIATALRRDVVSAWGTRSIHEIGRKDIIELIAAVKLRGLGAGTNTVKRISAFLMWCVGQGVIAHSPMVGLKLKPPERHRDRTLDDTELKAVILAARDLKNVGGPIIEVLALTGQRREEVAQMMWGEIDENARIWRLPAERSKNEKAHLVHLSEPVWEIIQSMPRKSKYIFATVTGTHFQAFKKAKRKIDEEISIPDWWVHDLRRTVVTGMARLGVAPHIADKILNHQSGTISGIAAVYQKFEFLEERKAALDLWAKHVCSLVGP
jgi:integrase